MTTTAEFAKTDAIDYGGILHRVNSESYLLSSDRDAAWLTALGLEIDAEFLDSLNQQLIMGSTSLHAVGNHDPIVPYIHQARELALGTLGLSNKLGPQESRRVPLDTIIRSVRCLYDLGITPESLAKIILTSPNILQQQPSTLLEKYRDLSLLGLPTSDLVRQQPTVLGCNIQHLRDRLDKLQKMGLDGVRIYTSRPRLIYQPSKETLLRVRNLKSLGLDAIAIINKHPTILGYSPERIRRYYYFVVRTAGLLGWQGSVKELLEHSPNIFSTDFLKLQMLRRIAAEYFSTERKALTAVAIGSLLYNPIENWLISMADMSDEEDLYAAGIKLKGRTISQQRLEERRQQPVTANELKKSLRHLHANRALKSGAVPQRIKNMYLQYKKI